jgi:hypothetical protein
MGVFGSRPRAPYQFMGMTNFLARDSTARRWPGIGENLHSVGRAGLGLAKLLVPNQTAASGHGHAKFLVRPALAQNQTYPKCQG